MQCLGRLVRDKNRGKFGDPTKYFHLELRCERIAKKGNKLCGHCQDRPTDLVKDQRGKVYHEKVLHGLIDEPIPDWSHIYGGKWYNESVLKYGQPSEEEMGKAKKAHLEAIGDLVEIPQNIIVIPPPVKVEEKVPTPKPAALKKERKKPGPRKVQSTTSLQSLQSTQSVQSVKSYESLSDALLPMKAIETDENPITDLEICKITVRPFVHEDVEYFLDSKKNRVYTMGADRRPKEYYGRYITVAGIIDTSISDSDDEE